MRQCQLLSSYIYKHTHCDNTRSYECCTTIIIITQERKIRAISRARAPLRMYVCVFLVPPPTSLSLSLVPRRVTHLNAPTAHIFNNIYATPRPRDIVRLRHHLLSALPLLYQKLHLRISEQFDTERCLYVCVCCAL